MEENKSYDVIASYAPARIRNAMKKTRPEQLGSLTEVRLRSGRRVSFVFPNGTKFLCETGALISDPKKCGLVVSAGEIRETVEALSRYSAHSYAREFREGFFAIGNGVRVGAAGRVSETADKRLVDINGLNFRVSRNVPGCAEPLFRRIAGESVLICGGVNSGKTTLLRDLCRLSGDAFKTVLIDERNEIAAVSNGVPMNDVGEMTDVISGGDRADGALMAVRTLSPDMIFCDEISNESDAEAILKIAGTGVRIAASAHGESLADINKRPALRRLIEAGAFEYAAVLEGPSRPSKIKEVRRLRNDT